MECTCKWYWHEHSTIERHFAWLKSYFELKYFQCFTLVLVMQFVQLSYIAGLALVL